MKLKVKKKRMSLEELPAGSMFICNGTLCLKTEYKTANGAIESHIVGSGEMFWGGTTTSEELNQLEVIKVNLKLK